MPDLLLGLDLGTTRICALVVEPGGRVLARAHRTLEATSPAPGRVEQDPEAMVVRSVEALREALAGAGAEAWDVAAVGLASQRATASRLLLTPTILITLSGSRSKSGKTTGGNWMVDVSRSTRVPWGSVTYHSIGP